MTKVTPTYRNKKMSEKKRTKDGMIKCSMTMNTTFLQKLEILSYAMEAKYISVEVLPIQSCFKVQHGFPILNKSLKPTLQAARKTK
ncbi:hypothetical protein VNO80_21012 [Phaseolus coccineus]|uniref:Uncharacterized protein n=1 Tax=Phaseolus coccineus TaxID=3886 RepID=A0AAN9M737_PHACN